MPDPNSTEPPPKPRVWPVFAGFFGAVVGVQLVGTIALVALVAARWGAFAPGTPLDERVTACAFSPIGVVLSVLASATALSALALLLGAKPTRLERLRLGPGRRPAWHVAVGALGALALSGLCGAAASHVPQKSFALDLFDSTLSKLGTPGLVLATAAIGLAAPVAEELFFRGFVQTRLAARWPRGLGVLISAVAFGVFHLDLVQGTVAAVLGIYLGWIVERTGSIRTSIAAHAVNNLFAVLAATTQSESTPSADIPVIVGSSVVFAAAVFVFARPSNQPELAPAVHEPAHGVLNKVDANDG
ncbi:MAG: CPBP family intramembrane glutamic endopeptidase [Polyangiaceae bacterium]